MISRRDKLLNYPFQQQRYEQHRQKVQSARPAIDFRTPATYPHVIIKPKKKQSEKERLKRIETENVRLLQKLGDIMRTKRLENFWQAPRPNFLHREKLFETRPQTCHPKLLSLYATYEAPIATNAKSSQRSRCPTCSGRPVYRMEFTPERIPWEPPRKSMNARNQESLDLTRKCLHCGHFKKPVHS